MAGRTWLRTGPCLAVFGVDALVAGRGLGHQVGSAALALLFTLLVAGESRAGRR